MDYAYIESQVSPGFRSLIVDRFSLTQEDLPLTRLLDYLLTGGIPDTDTGKPLLHRDICMSLRNSRGRTNSFVAQTMFDLFSQRFFPIQASGYVSKTKARHLVSMEAPSWLLEAWESNLKAPASERTVGFSSGDPVDPAARRAAAKAGAEEQRPLCKSRMVSLALDYLNGLDASHFEDVDANWAAAYEAAKAIGDEGSRSRETAVLTSIRNQPQPFYKPVPWSSRIYAHGASFLGCNAAIRDVLTRDWVKIDLRQAQFSIVSKVWNLPEIGPSSMEKLLSGHFSYRFDRGKTGIWHYLASVTGVDLTPENKGALKRAVYSALYGGGKRNIGIALAEAIGEEPAASFLKDRLIHLLLSASQLKQAQLGISGSMTDAYGRSLDLDEWNPDKKPQERIRSILSCVAQSYELPLLAPIFEYAKASESGAAPIFIAGFLHDGLFIRCPYRESVGGHIVEIRRLVDEESEQLLGFKIGLDVCLPNR